MKAYKRRAEARYYLGSYALVGADADAALRLDPMQKDLYKFKVGGAMLPWWVLTLLSG